MILNIRQERIKNGWTQQYVADQIGITKATLQRIETAQRKPSYEILVKLEDLFEKTIVNCSQQLTIPQSHDPMISKMVGIGNQL